MQSDTEQVWLPIVKSEFEEFGPEAFEKVLRTCSPRQRNGGGLRSPRQSLRFEVSLNTLGRYIRLGVERSDEKEGPEYTNRWLSLMVSGARRPEYGFIPIVERKGLPDNVIHMAQQTHVEVKHV